MNLWSLILTFVIIAAAELGDKTQLLTLGFAARFPVWQVIAAFSCASALLMALAVIFGGAITYYLPAFYLQILAGLLFVFFGLWTIWSKEKEEEKEEEKGKKKNIFWLVFSAFFLCELGDKTQLATFALAAKFNQPFQVWVGATLAMIAINCVAVVAGGWLKKHISEQAIKWFGGLVFVVFGLVTLVGLFIDKF